MSNCAAGVLGDEDGVDGVLSSWDGVKARLVDGMLSGRDGVEALLAAGEMPRAGPEAIQAPLSTSTVPSSRTYVMSNEVAAGVGSCSASQF
jgi:hypothetical protein